MKSYWCNSGDLSTFIYLIQSLYQKQFIWLLQSVYFKFLGILPHWNSWFSELFHSRYEPLQPGSQVYSCHRMNRHCKGSEHPATQRIRVLTRGVVSSSTPTPSHKAVLSNYRAHACIFNTQHAHKRQLHMLCQGSDMICIAMMRLQPNCCMRQQKGSPIQRPGSKLGAAERAHIWAGLKCKARVLAFSSTTDRAVRSYGTRLCSPVLTPSSTVSVKSPH